MFMRSFALPDLFTLFLAPCIGICALIGLCNFVNLRDWGCIKKCLLMTGVDRHEDFALFVVVHAAMFSASGSKLEGTVVRLSAGCHEVHTDSSDTGVFNQPLSLQVEQGTRAIRVELLDSLMQVLALLRFDDLDELLNGPNPIQEKIFCMKQRRKDVMNPRVKLSLRKDAPHEEEEGLMTSMVSTVLGPQELARSCTGPLCVLSDEGSRDPVYVAIHGPPFCKKYWLKVWQSQEQSREKGVEPLMEIDLMKIASVNPDPRYSEVFCVRFVAPDKTEKVIFLQTPKRQRDAWVENLVHFIQTVREEREGRRRCSK